jgi:hypothetical protein
MTDQTPTPDEGEVTAAPSNFPVPESPDVPEPDEGDDESPADE